MIHKLRKNIVKITCTKKPVAFNIIEKNKYDVLFTNICVYLNEIKLILKW